MDIFRISFYDDYRCIKGDCPENCCRGFLIPVEESTYQKLLGRGGLFALGVRFFISGQKDDRLLNRSRMNCHYLDKNKMCALQKRGIPQPHACVVFPRRRINLGIIAEETLDLSCPECARLFLRQDLPLKQIHVKGEVTYGRSGSNEDYEFLKGLLETRRELTGLIGCGAGMPYAGKTSDGEYFEQKYGAKNTVSGRSPTATLNAEELNARFIKALEYTGALQDICAMGKNPFETGVPKIKDTAPNAAAREDAAFTAMSFNGTKTSAQKLFPLDIGILNEWMNTDIYNSDLMFRIPELFNVCREYFKRFDKLDEQTGARRLEKLYKNFFRKRGEDVTKYASYACYNLYRFYTDTFEDYSFVKRIRDAVMHVNLLFLIDALYFDAHGELPAYMEARLLSSYEKRAFHSYGLRRDMYKKWTEHEE